MILCTNCNTNTVIENHAGGNTFWVCTTCKTERNEDALHQALADSVEFANKIDLNELTIDDIFRAMTSTGGL